MSKKLKSEEDVKKELKVTDYNSMSEEQINSFIRMFPRIDKDVAMKIIDQMPDYTKFANETIKSLSMMSNDALKIADEGSKETIRAYQRIIDSLAEHLKDGNLSKEEREHDIELMIELAEKIDAKDEKRNSRVLEMVKEHSKNVLKVVGIVGIAVVGIALGSKAIDDNKK